VENNTVYGNSGVGIGVNEAVRDPGNADGAAGYMISAYDDIFMNNIVAFNQTDSGAKSYLLGWGDDTSGSDAVSISDPKPGIPVVANVSDYNDFYIKSANPFFIGSGTNRYSTLAQWQAASGQDEHSVWGDPDFVNPSSGDFHLGSTSAAAMIGNYSTIDPYDADIVPEYSNLTDTGTTYGTYGANTGNLPAGWTNANIGESGGTAYLENGDNVINMAGAGSGLNSTADSFDYAYESSSGNTTIIARVDRMDDTASNATAGLMFRDSTANNTLFAYLALTPGDGLIFQYRSETGGASGISETASGVTGPVWLMLTRYDGTYFSAYYSTDGLNWTKVASNLNLSMTSTVLAGLAVSSDDSGTLCNAIISNEQITSTGNVVGLRMPNLVDAGAYEDSTPSLPSGWSDVDIQEILQTGYGYQGSNNTINLSGGGASISGAGDHLNYAYENYSGDGSIIALVNSQDDTGANADAGVMFRNSTADNDIFADVVVTPSRGVQFQWRSTVGGDDQDTAVTGITAPIWVKLTRSGDSFTAYYSTDGGTWTQIGSAETIDLSTATLAGLVDCSNNTSEKCHVTFSNVEIGTSSSTSAPNAPSNLAAIHLITDPTQAQLEWVDNSTNETSLVLQRSTASDFSANLVTTTLPANTTTWNDTGLTSGVTYYYRIQATNGAGSSAYSSTFTLNPVPAAPTALSATYVSGSYTSVYVTWSGTLPAGSGWVLERSSSSTFPPTSVTFTQVDPSRNYQYDTVAAGVTYYYRIKEHTPGGGDSAFSSTVMVTPSTVPAAPTGLTATRTSTYDGDYQAITLNWTALSSNQSSFGVQVSTNGTTWTTFSGSGVPSLPSASATSWTVYGPAILAGTTYYLRIYAINADGSSGYSNVITI
jgi:hypothetical protein